MEVAVGVGPPTEGGRTGGLLVCRCGTPDGGGCERADWGDMGPMCVGSGTKTGSANFDRSSATSAILLSYIPSVVFLPRLSFSHSSPSRSPLAEFR